AVDLDALAFLKEPAEVVTGEHVAPQARLLVVGGGRDEIGGAILAKLVEDAEVGAALDVATGAGVLEEAHRVRDADISPFAVEEHQAEACTAKGVAAGAPELEQLVGLHEVLLHARAVAVHVAEVAARLQDTADTSPVVVATRPL